MSLNDLLPLLTLAETALIDEITNWQDLENETWVDIDSLNAIVSQLEQDVSNKTELLSNELSSLFENIEHVFELNQEQFSNVTELYEEYKALIAEFSDALEEQHIPDFDFSFDAVEEEAASVIEGIKEEVEALVGTLECDVSERFDGMQNKTLSAVEETQNCLETSLDVIREKVESVQSCVVSAFDSNKESIEEKQSETSDNTELLKTQLNKQLDDLFNSLTSEIRGLNSNFEDVGRELDSIQQNIQYTMDTASECMKLCGLGMNSGANSLNTVKSCLDGVV